MALRRLYYHILVVYISPSQQPHAAYLSYTNIQHLQVLPRHALPMPQLLLLSNLLTPIQRLQLPLKKVLLQQDLVRRAQLPRISLKIIIMRQRTQALLHRHRLIDLIVHIGRKQPVIAQLGAAVQVHGSDDAHVALPPLAPAVGHLVLEELERVQTELTLRDLEGFLEVGCAFVLHEHEVAVRLVLADFLQHPDEVDAAEEVAPGEGGDGGRRKLVGGDAELVDFGGHSGSRERRRARGEDVVGAPALDGWWCGFVFRGLGSG